MTQAAHTPTTEALTALILDLFRLNNMLLNSGDKLVAGIGLTSARWQVLGSIVASERPQPVAWLARDMGANRQNLQRIINDLATDGLVEFHTNPHHRRAQLVVLTEKGRLTYDAAMALQAPWSKELAEGLTLSDIAAAQRTMSHLQQRLAAISLSEG